MYDCYPYDYDNTELIFDESGQEQEKPISLPHRYTPRDYQIEPWEAHFIHKKKRLVKIWHRRAGKDKNIWNMFIAATQEEIGVYYYMLPTIAQARKVIYEGIDNDGMRFIDHIPDELIVHHDKGEMKWELINGSIIRLLGSDNYDSIVGTNPKGIVFSEWSLCNPISWEFFRPILRLNGGWAWFVYTPRGRNHGFTTYEIAKSNPKWHLSYLTINDTGLLTDEDVQDEIEQGADPDTAEQEYYLSFDAATKGAYYAKQVKDVYSQGRYKEFDVEPNVQCMTFWDLGISDSMSIWILQVVGGEPRVVDYYENCDEGMEHYCNYLHEWKTKHKVDFSEHFAPHDIEVRELTNGMSRRDTARKMGIKFRVVERMPVADGIEALRRLIPKLWFRKGGKTVTKNIGKGKATQAKVTGTGVEFLLNCLSSYHKKYDERKRVFHNHPEHDWSSHCCDAGRMMAQAFKQMGIEFKAVKIKAPSPLKAQKPKGYVSPLKRK